MKLLMVCLGNICRSPLAEGIMKEKLKKSGLNFFVDSAGMIGYHAGEHPDDRSIVVAKRHGIDISEQVARKFSENDFETFDFIFAMDISVFDQIILLAQSETQKRKVHLFLDFAGRKILTEVPDPYYGSEKEFEEVFLLIDEAGEKIVKRFLKN